MTVKNPIELITGFLVLFIASWFLYFTYSGTNLSSDSSDGYAVSAKFDRADGIALGSDVRVSGIKIGSVSGTKLDKETYQAVVELQINKDIKLPEDSSAEIIGDGLLGGKLIAIIPGGAEENLEAGSEIKFTQSSISLESLIGKFVFGSANKDKDAEKDSKKPKSETQI